MRHSYCLFIPEFQRNEGVETVRFILQMRAGVPYDRDAVPVFSMWPYSIVAFANYAHAVQCGVSSSHPSVSTLSWQICVRTSGWKIAPLRRGANQTGLVHHAACLPLRSLWLYGTCNPVPQV